MTPVTGTGCSVKGKVQMRWEKCVPHHKPNFHPWLCVSMLGGGCGDTEPGVGVPLSCTTAVPCATLFSGLGRGTQSKNTGTLLRAAEGRLILTKYYLVRALHALYHPRNSSVLGDEMHLDMRHCKSCIQVQSKFTIKNCLEV